MDRTIRMCARELSITKSRVWQYVYLGKLSATMRGNRAIVTQEEWDDFISNRYKKGKRGRPRKYPPIVRRGKKGRPRKDEK